MLEENSTASSWNMKSIRQRKVFVERKRHHFDEIHSTAFTILFPIGIQRTLFFSRELFEKPQEKSGFSIENRNSEAHCFSERV